MYPGDATTISRRGCQPVRIVCQHWAGDWWSLDRTRELEMVFLAVGDLLCFSAEMMN